MTNPHLPDASPDLGPLHTRRLRPECGPQFFQACLELSQSLWLQKKPAQAILQLNKAAMVIAQPMPFEALAWYLRNRQDDLFIGNPVRHFQHLASRMSGQNALPRTWRAWACLHLAEKILPPLQNPRDHQQLQNEDLLIPSLETVQKNLPTFDRKGLARAMHPR